MLNFKKETVFSRDNHFISEVAETSCEGVLAVWGSPSSGKSTTAFKIAKHLADKKKNVILLLCDTTAPMLPAVIPPSELEVEKSLGSILAATHVSEPLVKYNMVTLKRNPYLSIIGMLKGENEFTYAPYKKPQAEELIKTLREIAPYVVIDCSSYIANDVLSAVSLMKADNVLRLVNCDLKSISYLSSQLPLLQGSENNLENHYKVASNVRSYHGVDQMVGALGSIVFKIPHSDEVEQQFLQGNILAELDLKNSREFRTEISKITKEVFGI